ncbi:hypothetical protein FA15DRAFT_662601 [Coprinopsis marcescibilis]|uniref:Uncharacterized protein n=1 Tax=Coprinopsis marcescibilis TaxID=230819 RepID=A0A5C3LEP0_COPMA|nr:hypothetical protein FA15DRAFT_662601 [Coprinopsis marcescibilis]
MPHDDGSENKNVDGLAASLAAATIENPSPSPNDSNLVKSPQAWNASSTTSRIYTRAQLLSLHDSPLVKPPADMPDLKTWFGVENEQSLSKKDPDASTPSGTRDRRFRRDYEDGETPARTSFRTTVTQPSQMGNFKHQSLRERDKERDRDGDKDRERDTRDKEGQERLRNLSDKYDRDRMGIASTGSRNKDRDGAHPSSTAGRSAQTAGTAASSRRNEPRDGAKRKAAESGDDWRRGGNDTSRSTRDERSEPSRRDRDERESGRSRPRDTSRSRPEPTRRDREDARARDKDDSRRDRDKDDDEDARHWRDDGKRDERMTARRARERQAGDSWEPSNERDRRWAAEDRDGRYKRPNGRERRPGQDETKERDERREREKEKEPAWMDTYVPSEPLPGILGGKTTEGELDSIQVWKKGMKDKENQEKDKDKGADSEVEDRKSEVQSASINSTQLDEIQMFRLMMQKEKDKRETDIVQDTSHTPSHTTIHPDSSLPSTAVAEHAQVVLPTAASGASAHQEQDKGAMGPDVHMSQTVHANHVSQPYSQDNRLLQTAPHLPSTTANGNAPSEHFVPPAGSRLLALGRGPKPSPQTQNPTLQAPAPKDANVFSVAGPTRNQPSRGGGVGFSPFEEAAAAAAAAAQLQVSHGSLHHPESQQRLQLDRPSNSQYTSVTPDSALAELNSNGYNATKGSRFAKFFDGKTRDGPSSAKSHSPVGFASSSPIPGPRLDQGSYGPPPSNQEERRTVDELFAMLSNSQNPNIGVGLTGLQPGPGGFNGHPNLQTIQHPHHQNVNRVESLYDSRLDDRSFIPNDMVPGLRTFPPPRVREPYPDEDAILHLQRLSQQHQQQQQLHHRNDPSFSGPLNPLFNQQPHRSMPVQQPQFRSNVVPPGPHQLLQQNPQRFPPGLANLGNRPPHSDPSQFIGLPGVNQLPGLSNNNQVPQQYNNFNNNNIQYNAAQFRAGLPPINLHQGGSHLPLNIAQNDPRLTNQHFNPGVVGGIGLGGQRIPNNGIGVQQRPGPHLQGAQLGLRPQQSQVPHHLLPHMHPSNVPTQHSNNQPAQDLMALLMGGTRVE